MKLEGTSGEQGQIQLASTAGIQDCALLGLEYFQHWRLHKFSGQPIPVFNHPQSTKNSFHYVHIKFVMSLVPFLDMTESF